jgi:hypothetical protein
MKPETKFYAQVKRNFTEIQWTRLENLSVPGTPDLLGYNNNCHFFTIELKVLDASLNVPKLYEGSCIRDLVAGGLKLKPKESGFKDIEKFLSLLGA